MEWIKVIDGTEGTKHLIGKILQAEWNEQHKMYKADGVWLYQDEVESAGCAFCGERVAEKTFCDECMNDGTYQNYLDHKKELEEIA